MYFIFGLAKSYSSPESKINKETIKYLDEKKTTALELSASATAVSTLITLAPEMMELLLQIN